MKHIKTMHKVILRKLNPRGMENVRHLANQHVKHPALLATKVVKSKSS